MDFLGFDMNVDVREWWLAVVETAKPRVMPSATVFLLAIVGHGIASRILVRIEKRVAQRTATVVDDHVISFLRTVLPPSIVAWAAWRLLIIWALPTPASWVVACWIAFLFFPLSRLVGDLLAAA